MSQLDNNLDRDLARLVHDDPMPSGAPDTAGLIRRGTRLRRRRQLAVSAGVGLAAAAVVAPFLLLGGGADEASDLAPADRPAASASAKTDTDPDGTTFTAGVCGIAACSVSKGPYGSVEQGELIGTQFEVGTYDGHTEVLYAARNKGFDMDTGEPRNSVDVFSAGIVVNGTLRRTVWAWQGGDDDLLGPVFLYGAQRTIAEDGTPQFAMFGLITGEHQEVTATIDGQSRPVAGVSTTVYPGYTAFYDRGAWDESWGDRADVTYGVPGGPSCSIAECGMLG